MARTTRLFARKDTRRRRERRYNLSVTPLKLRTSSARANQSPPVLVRMTTGSMARPMRRKTRPKRRFDVALPNTGAEIRLPALPRIKIGWRALTAIVVISMSVLIYLLWSSPKFRISSPKLVGLQRLTAMEVNAAIDLNDQPIFTVNPAQVEKKLVDDFPEFSAVAMAVSFPNSVVITVTERVPVLIWHQEGRSQLVDDNGIAFPVRQQDSALKLPLIEAKTSPPAPPPAMDAQQVLDKLNGITPAEDILATPSLQKESKLAMQPEMVAGIELLAKEVPSNVPITYDPTHGMGWKDPRGWEVYFGDMVDVAMKLKVYKAVVTQLNAEGIQPKLISVEFVHAPYYQGERKQDG